MHSRPEHRVSRCLPDGDRRTQALELTAFLSLSLVAVVAILIASANAMGTGGSEARLAARPHGLAVAKLEGGSGLGIKPQLTPSAVMVAHPEHNSPNSNRGDCCVDGIVDCS